MKSDDYNSEDYSDLTLAIRLLDGFTKKDRNDLMVKTYFEASSEEDLEARRALARLLMNGKPLDSVVRDCLAVLFCPILSSEFAKSSASQVKEKRSGSERQIQFKKQSRRSREGDRRLQIALEMVRKCAKGRQGRSSSCSRRRTIQNFRKNCVECLGST